MPPRKTIPQDRGFFFSESDYIGHAAQNIGQVELWARSDSGIWYRSGVMVPEKDVPGDLWRVRMEQR